MLYLKTTNWYYIPDPLTIYIYGYAYLYLILLMHYENWRNLLKAFAIMDICDTYQSCKQSGGQMFHHEICDRFGKKDAKLRIA